MHWIITLCLICATINLSASVFRMPTFKKTERSSAVVPFVNNIIHKIVQMETSGKNDVEDIVIVENKIKPNEQTAEREKLVLELTDMGFAKPLVLKIIDNASDLSKDSLVEQLLTTETGEPIPVVDDDGDELWVDLSDTYKMVIVINLGLNMSIGKIASQASHATLGLYELIKRRPGLTKYLNAWKEEGCRKIVVQAKNAAELKKVCLLGKSHKVPFTLIQDAGRTQVQAGSCTAAAFFGSDDQLKPVTGSLRLLQ